MGRGASHVGSSLRTLHVEVTNCGDFDVATVGEDAEMALSDSPGSDEPDSHGLFSGAGRTRN